METIQTVKAVVEYLNNKCLPNNVATAHTRVYRWIYDPDKFDWNQSAWDAVKQHYDMLKSRV